MRKSETKQSGKKHLLRALNANLSAIEKTPWVRSLSDGREYVCSTCNQSVKPCESDPGAMCSHMLRDGTDAELLESALKHPDETVTGVCVSCGKRLTPTQLRKNPVAEVCPECSRKEQRQHLPKAKRA